MRTIEDYQAFVSFLRYNLEDVDLDVLQKEFESIQTDLGIISLLREKKRYLKFSKTYLLFGLRIVGYDYATQQIAALNPKDESYFMSIPWDKQFTEPLVKMIIGESKN